MIWIAIGQVEFHEGVPYFAREDRYIRDLSRGGNDFNLAAYYIRNGCERRNTVQAAPLFGRGVTSVTPFGLLFKLLPVTDEIRLNFDLQQYNAQRSRLKGAHVVARCNFRFGLNKGYAPDIATRWLYA